MCVCAAVLGLYQSRDYLLLPNCSNLLWYFVVLVVLFYTVFQDSTLVTKYKRSRLYKVHDMVECWYFYVAVDGTNTVFAHTPNNTVCHWIAFVISTISIL